MKKQNKKQNKQQNKQQNKKQNSRIMKGMVCYKIRIIPRSNNFIGGNGGAVDRLESMIKDEEVQKNDDLIPFLKSIGMYNKMDFIISESIKNELNGNDEALNIKRRRDKVFKEILNENTMVDSKNTFRDTKEERVKKETAIGEAIPMKCLLYYLKNGRHSDELRNKLHKEDLEKQLKNIENSGDTKKITNLQQQISAASNKISELSTLIKNDEYRGKLYQKEDIDTLSRILLRKSTAYDALKQIIENLDSDAVKKQLTPLQIKAIKDQIEGTGSITSALASVKASFSNGAVSLGNWLVPDMVDNDDTLKDIENKQKITFLWYPRKHIDYKKGDSGSKRGPDDAMEYGDFMIMIEPEQYASTGEFFKQTYHSVEDLIATLLMGCSKPFCLDGSVKREPYNFREYEITNTQPKIDRDKKRNAALTEQ